MCTGHEAKLLARLVIHNLAEEVQARVERRARRQGRSTEEEVRAILRNAVQDEGGSRKRLGNRLRALFAGIRLEDELPEVRGEIAPEEIRGL